MINGDVCDGGDEHNHRRHWLSALARKRRQQSFYDDDDDDGNHGDGGGEFCDGDHFRDLCPLLWRGEVDGKLDHAEEGQEGTAGT